MIIFQPCCGLGNQMFQYAVARSLAAKHDVKLFYDKSYYSRVLESDLPTGSVHRKFELDIFNIDAKESNGYENLVLKRVRSRRFIKRIMALAQCRTLRALGFKRHFLNYAEKGPQYDKAVIMLPDDLILEGYFVSYKYFEHCSELIKKDFSFSAKPDIFNKEMIDNIISRNSVSIHIRRGDYVSNKIVLEKFGVCGLEYYKKAVDYVACKINSPHFYIFSDDPDWVLQNFRIEHKYELVTQNLGRKDYEDLRLMSLCKHNIIANSTFSWWGGWLNSNPDKVVIAPTPAFNELEIVDDDFYPKDWVRLPRV